MSKHKLKDDHPTPEEKIDYSKLKHPYEKLVCWVCFELYDVCKCKCEMCDYTRDSTDHREFFKTSIIDGLICELCKTRIKEKLKGLLV